MIKTCGLNGNMLPECIHHVELVHDFSPPLFAVNPRLHHVLHLGASRCMIYAMISVGMGGMTHGCHPTTLWFMEGVGFPFPA